MMTFQYFFFSTYFGDFLQAVPLAALAMVLCLLVRRRLYGRRSWPREPAMALFAGYLAGLWALVLTPNNLVGEVWYRIFYHQSGGVTFDLPLWDTSRWAWSTGLGGLLRPEALGNLLLFLPLGFFLSLLWPRLGWRVLPLGLGVSLAVEVLQMPLGRSFDVRDLVMNTLGTGAGILLFLLFRLITPGAARAAGRRAG